jgi:SAM-dependent methyltransferase
VTDWQAYYDENAGRAPREALLEAIEGSPAGEAIDLGSGTGIEARALLAHGWRVLAIDREPEAIVRLRAGVPDDALPRLSTRVAAFEELEDLPRADLVYAGFSLPFCRPAAFPRLWGSIRSALVPGGLLVVELFGVRDSWADDPEMTFHTEDQVRALLDGFAVDALEEDEHDGEALSGPKHWHIFHVVARSERSRGGRPGSG